MDYQHIRKILASRGLSVRKLAHRAGIASQDLYSALNGRKPFYPKWRKLIAAALEMQEDELFPPEGSGEKMQSGLENKMIRPEDKIFRPINKMDEAVCCICGKPIAEGSGRDPWPFAYLDADGPCCEVCYQITVRPAQVEALSAQDDPEAIKEIRSRAAIFADNNEGRGSEAWRRSGR